MRSGKRDKDTVRTKTNIRCVATRCGFAKCPNCECRQVFRLDEDVVRLDIDGKRYWKFCWECGWKDSQEEVVQPTKTKLPSLSELLRIAKECQR